MKRLFASFLVGSVTSFSLAAEFNVNGHTFTLPDGFTIELVAKSPLVDRPIEADFDHDGRLYVTDSSGTNDKVEKQLAERPHRIVRLEDTDGDGKFDKSVVFADKMMFPEGAMWLEGSLYVSAPPSIWKLTDTDGDGVADQREEWFKGQTVTGCANDLHGPYAGPDGWIYWNKGAFAKQTHDRAGQHPLVTRAAHTFRIRPDGTGLEAVMTGGMDNPVGLAFTPEGERFFTSTFLLNPQAGQRDGLVHAIYGGVYGKQNDVNDDHPQTGELMPITTHLGAAAPAGLMRYESGVMGEQIRNNLFVAQFNMHKVSRHVVAVSGSTFKTLDSDFVVAADTDFHPTDVFEDADGSILIIDTGGWYKLCCPTSQLAKPDVLGAIYRVRRNGAKVPADPWGRQIDWKTIEKKTLLPFLADARPAVARRATRELARHPELAAELSQGHFHAKSVSAKINAIWTLCQMSDEKGLSQANGFLQDEQHEVRIAAMHALSAHRWAKARSNLENILGKAKPAEQRAAAEALGRLRDVRSVPEILGAASQSLDRALEHSLAYALIEIGSADAIRPALRVNDARRKVALLALSQLPNGLKASDIAPFLTAKSDLRAIAEWIAARHPEWGAELADLFRARLQKGEGATLESILPRLAASKEIQQLLADFASGNKDSALIALRAMGASGQKKPPQSWTDAVTTSIANADADIKKQAIATARSLNAGKDAKGLHEALSNAAADEKNPAPIRIAAMRSLPDGFKVPDAAFAMLLGSIDPQQPVEVRGDAVATLTRSALTEDQRLQLADALATAGPMELSRLTDAFEKDTRELLGLRLVEAFKKSTVTASLPPDWLAQKLSKFPATVREAAKALPQVSQQDTAAQRGNLEQMLASLKGGDIVRGQAIFNSTKAACISCHSIGYLGGKLGPDLTSIGQVRTEIDLLEAILYPSASFVRSYEPVFVKTKNGDVHTGILRGDTEQQITLASGPNAEEKIARAEIEEMRPGALSIMPAGLETQLSRQELADLLAFLKGTKWGAN